MTTSLIAPTPLATFVAKGTGRQYQADQFCLIQADPLDAPSLVLQGCVQLPSNANPNNVWDGVRLQGRTVDATAPTDGYVLTWSASAKKWAPAAIPSTPAVTFGHAVIVGAAAGNLTATGITTASTLMSVIQYIGAGTAVTDVVDLTSEFTITAANTINNTGGTDTTGSKLVVTWHS